MKRILILLAALSSVVLAGCSTPTIVEEVKASTGYDMNCTRVDMVYITRRCENIEAICYQSDGGLSCFKK